MNTKQILLSTFILGAIAHNTSAMENRYTIEADVKNMLSICEQQCSFTKDVIQNCTSKCFTAYGKQREDFLVRKYTQQCSGEPFNEEWFFKTDVKSKCIDMRNTFNAYEKWENPTVANCAKNCMLQHQQIMKQLQKEEEQEFVKSQEKHPVLSRGVNFYSWIRHGK